MWVWDTDDSFVEEKVLRSSQPVHLGDQDTEAWTGDNQVRLVYMDSK